MATTHNPMKYTNVLTPSSGHPTSRQSSYTNIVASGHGTARRQGSYTTTNVVTSGIGSARRQGSYTISNRDISVGNLATPIAPGMTHHSSNRSYTGSNGEGAGPMTTYTDAFYRPTNAVFVRNTNDFSHPYNTLYPVHSVATFEQPIQWRHTRDQYDSSSMSSSSRALSFDGSISRTTHATTHHYHEHDVVPTRSIPAQPGIVPTQQKKKKAACCQKKPKTIQPIETTVVEPRVVVQPVQKPNKKKFCGKKTKASTHVLPTQEVVVVHGQRSMPIDNSTEIQHHHHR